MLPGPALLWSKSVVFAQSSATCGGGALPCACAARGHVAVDTLDQLEEAVPAVVLQRVRARRAGYRPGALRRAKDVKDRFLDALGASLAQERALAVQQRLMGAS